MTYSQYKEVNLDKLRSMWLDTGKPCDFDEFCFNEYKQWMSEA